MTLQSSSPIKVNGSQDTADEDDDSDDDDDVED